MHTQAFYISFENLRAFSWPALAGTIIMAWNGLKIWHEIEKIIYQLCFQFKAGLFWLFWAKLKFFLTFCLWLSFSLLPSLQNLCCCLALLRGRSWFVRKFYPCGLGPISVALLYKLSQLLSPHHNIWQQQHFGAI